MVRRQEAKCSPIEQTLSPNWDDDIILDIPDVRRLLFAWTIHAAAQTFDALPWLAQVRDDTQIDLTVADSKTGAALGLLGIPVHQISRNPARRWIKLHNPEGGRSSFSSGVMDVGQTDLSTCPYGAIELEHSLKWKTSRSLRERIVEVMIETTE